MLKRIFKKLQAANANSLSILLALSIFVTGNSLALAQEELLFSKVLSQGAKSNFNYTGVAGSNKDYVTWSTLSDLGPGQFAAGPGNRTPAILQGSSGNYWVGRTCGGEGLVIIGGSARTSDYKNLKLRIKLAAAGDVDDNQNTFTTAHYIRIEASVGGVDSNKGPFGGRGPGVLDLLRGTAGVLKSLKTGQTVATNFSVLEYDLDSLYNVAPGTITAFGRLVVKAKTACNQVIGIDSVELWGTPKDQCPNDPDKTEPGICGCGIPDETPFCLLNNDFEMGDLTNWTASASGSASVISENNNFVGRMETDSSELVSLSIPANTPDEGFYVQFQAKFGSNQGQLVVSLKDTDVMHLSAPTNADSELKTYTVFVPDEDLRGLNLQAYKFSYSAPSGAVVQIDNVVLIPQSAFGTCSYEGDAIGSQASWEGLATKGTVGTLGTNRDYWDWNWNSAHTGILFNSDGMTLLSELKALQIVGYFANQQAFHTWKCSLWTIDIWTVNGYLSKAQPIVTANLGIQADNWPGFKTITNDSVVPDIDIFTNSGAPNNMNGYLGIWNLNKEFYTSWEHSQATVLDPWSHGSQTFAPFASPLPAGDYIIGFQPRGGLTSCGDSGLIRDTNRAVGPIPYYSNPNVPPQPIYPGLNSNANYRYAMNLGVSGPYCTD